MHFTSQVNPKGHPFGENFSLYYGTAPGVEFQHKCLFLSQFLFPGSTLYLKIYPIMIAGALSLSGSSSVGAKVIVSLYIVRA